MRLSPLWILLLLQDIPTTCADPQAASVPTDRVADAADTPGQEVFFSSKAGTQKTSPGSELVDAARAKLSAIPSQPYERPKRQGSLLSTLLHFAMKAMPSLSARAPPSAPTAIPGQDQDQDQDHLPAPLREAVGLLEEAAARDNNPDALYLLAEMNFYGNYTHPRNFPYAFSRYSQLARDYGNSSAMYMVGLMYSTGIGGSVVPDQARALLYYTFAALRGHTRAEMTVADRHHAGIGTPRSCDTAVKYYKRVADKAIAWHRAGPPGGMAWVPQPFRIADEHGGIYGEGASAVSSGINAMRAQPHSDAYASIEDIIEYLDLMAQKGDVKAALNVGRIFYEGQRGLERDVGTARKYFLMVASKYWRKDGRVVDSPKPGLDKTAGKAAGFLGRIYLRGDGLEAPHYERARQWLERGFANDDAQSQYLLGLMLLRGLGGVANVARATDYLKAAAEQDYAPAQVEMGVLFLDQGRPEDVRTANDYFELAARYGNMEAYYYLGEMSLHGVGRDKACAPALAYYKSVAEKADPLVSSWAEANRAYAAGDYELALLAYLGAAEQGYERAQNNVAFMLDTQQSNLPLPAWLARAVGRRVLSGSASPAAAAAAAAAAAVVDTTTTTMTGGGLLDNAALGLVHWTRSSRQNNVDALVKMGDYYLGGVGTERSVDKAVQCYTGASEYHQSAQALYNLGWMHENGVGLDQDFHLAKRYYDVALAANEEAYLPVTLSLLKLRLRSAWNTLTRGSVNSIRDEPVPQRAWSLREWLDTFTSSSGSGSLYFNDDDGGLYDDLYDEAYMDENGDLDALDELSLFEPFAIIGLVMAILYMLYYRQQRQVAHQEAVAVAAAEAEAAAAAAVQQQQQREEAERQRQQQQQPNDGGVFPRPDDPAQADWLAGGVGH